MPEYFQMSEEGKAWLTTSEIVGTKEEIDEIVSQLQEVVETCPVEGIEYTIEEIEE
jgi:ferredoxin